MRNTPVMIFINKMDREGISPYDLLDELEQNLKLQCVHTPGQSVMANSLKAFIIFIKRRFRSFTGKTTISIDLFALRT